MSNSAAILTSYFSKKKHPNHPSDSYVVGRTADGKVQNNEIEYIKPWYESVDKLKLKGFIFYDNLSDAFVEQYTTEDIKFIKVNRFNDGRDKVNGQIEEWNERKNITYTDYSKLANLV